MLDRGGSGHAPTASSLQLWPVPCCFRLPLCCVMPALSLSLSPLPHAPPPRCATQSRPRVMYAVRVPHRS